MFRQGQHDKRLSSMLNKRVEVWHNVKSNERNELGQYPVIDTLYASLWAGIIPQTASILNGRTADTTLSKTTHKIVIRYREDINPDMWIIYNGHRYNILGILDPYANHERLELFCESVL